MPHLLAIDFMMAAATTAKKSSSGTLTLLLLVVFFGVFYFFIIRPRQQKSRKVREQVRAAEVGDEIATIGGLVGTIVSEEGDRVTVSTGNGTELVFLRQAIGRKIEPVSPSPVDDTSGEFSGPVPGFDNEPTTEDHKSGEPDAK